MTKKRPGRELAKWGVFALILLLMLYVVSLGPAWRYVLVQGYSNQNLRRWQTAYAPILWVGTKSDVVNRLTRSYMFWCLPTEEAKE